MTELDKIIEQRNATGAKMIVLVFEIIAILLCPIAIVLYFGGIMQSSYGVGKIPVFVAALSVLSLSWIVIWKIYIKIDLEMQSLDTKIRLTKIQAGYNPELNKIKQKAYDEDENDIENEDNNT